ncbi:MAG: hypothetical protein A3I05_07690 [Deltaproteobacteria bacterium RIFCSPLOWO2_02_FULL_44_10]|nr:MAG: hypothetical protein A3C46_09535 [Deltaproteobacteria bacterium RIFCSPHIGHO2_02_FULL_44_16]OGQ46762.1 MAG: hypothetical protein A3I05_07690 [Deltaproteobacteria bacterium RIFCSPLOWO2_02_FULL_44_10]
MNQRITWEEAKKNYPDEWIAFADYREEDGFPVEGILIVHNPDRKQFHETVGKLLPQYGAMALQFTGAIIKNPDIPLLWQISHTESTDDLSLSR